MFSRPIQRLLTVLVAFGTAAAAFVVDIPSAAAAGPTCAIAIPSANAYLHGTGVTLDAAPGSGTTRVDFYVKPTTGARVDIGQAYPTIYGWLYSPNGGATWGWDSTSVADGAKTLSCRAQNSAGTWGAYADIPVTVDNTAPDVSIVLPTPTAAGNGLTNGFGGSVTLDATASDNIALVPNQVTWLVDNAVVGTAGPTIYGYVLAWNSHTVADGSHVVTARVTDGAGNTKTSAPVTIFVNNSDLGLAISPWWIAPDGAPPPGTPFNGSSPSWWQPPWGATPPSNSISEDATAVSIGAKWIRAGIPWYEIQPTGPSNWQWTRADTLVRDAKAAGLKVLWVLSATPQWAAGCPVDSGHPGSCSSVTPDAAHLAAFQTFAQTIAQRYGPNATDNSLKNGVQAYEVWNEPNTASFLHAPDGQVAPATYLTMLKGAHDGIKAAAPAATVVSGGPSWFGSVTGVACAASTPPAAPKTACNAYDWYLTIYNAGYNQYFDAMGSHPYGADPNGIANGHTNNGLTQTPFLRALMLGAGETGKKIWATELGQPSGGNPNPGCPSMPGCSQVDPSVLEQYVDTYIDGWRGFHDGNGTLYTGPLMWYTLFDGYATNTAEPGGANDWHYGLYYQDTTYCTNPPTCTAFAFTTPQQKGQAATHFHARA